VAVIVATICRHADEPRRLTERGHCRVIANATIIKRLGQPLGFLEAVR
jgi:hypothetical protein